MELETSNHKLQIDRRVFQWLFDQHFNALCAFGSRYIANRLAVEDLIQDVFISLWEQRANFEHEKGAKAFLYTAVRNKCLNHLKHLAVLKKHEEQLIYELESNQIFSEQVIEEEAFNQLFQEINHLPDASRKIMLLALKGHKNKEIASTLGISENTVKTQKKIAYSKLKLKLSPPILTLFLSF